MPASTRFLATSLASARMLISRMCALRILHTVSRAQAMHAAASRFGNLDWASMPHSRIWRS